MVTLPDTLKTGVNPSSLSNLELETRKHSDPIPVDNPCIVFDFRGAIDDERLMLIATMAVNNFINRYLRVNSKFRAVEKEIQKDCH